MLAGQMRADAARRLLEQAPMRSFDAVAGSGPLLILAPHPDDESLGCGGLIAEACERGRETWVVILTDGGASHPNSPSWPRERLVTERAREAAAAVACLGLPAERLLFLGVPDAAAPTWGAGFDALVSRLRALLTRHRIATVLACWRADPHGDHEAAAAIAAAACAAEGVRHLAYPVWSWMLPGEAEVPDPTGRAMRLDIARHLPAKRRAIGCHATQHAGLIDDDPDGFVLPAAFLARFDGPTEVFISES
jgi:LmbE family N-acetylglucosaminyl deacetylase